MHYRSRKRTRARSLGPRAAPTTTTFASPRPALMTRTRLSMPTTRIACSRGDHGLIGARCRDQPAQSVDPLALNGKRHVSTDQPSSPLASSTRLETSRDRLPPPASLQEALGSPTPRTTSLTRKRKTLPYRRGPPRSGCSLAISSLSVPPSRFRLTPHPW